MRIPILTAVLSLMLLVSALPAQQLVDVFGRDREQDERIAALDTALEAALSKYDERIEAVEQKTADIESRLAKLESLSKPADAIKRTIVETQPAKAAPAVPSGRWTRAELESWIRQRYTPSTPLRYGVMARGAEGQVWRHLIDHGFSSSQVNGLEYWVAAALHDAAHGGRISPYRSGAASRSTSTALASNAYPSPSASASRTVQRSVTVQRSYGSCANGQCARPAFALNRRRKGRW